MATPAATVAPGDGFARPGRAELRKARAEGLVGKTLP